MTSVHLNAAVSHAYKSTLAPTPQSSPPTGGEMISHSVTRQKSLGFRWGISWSRIHLKITQIESCRGKWEWQRRRERGENGSVVISSPLSAVSYELHIGATRFRFMIITRRQPQRRFIYLHFNMRGKLKNFPECVCVSEWKYMGDYVRAYGGISLLAWPACQPFASLYKAS